jgi:hypothetical protein
MYRECDSLGAHPTELIADWPTRGRDALMAQRSSYSQGTPSWVDLQTPDQQAAKAFYGSVLGWTFDDQPVGDGVVYSLAMLGDDRIAAIAPPNPFAATDGPPMWTTYLTVDDVDAATARAVAAGGTVVMPAMDVMGAGRTALVVDPAGAPIALWQAGAIAGATRVNEPGTLIWNELVTDDPATALPFYEAVAGMTATMDLGTGDPYTLFEADGAQVGATIAPAMDGVANHWHVYFAVADVDVAAAQVGAAGGTIVVAPFDTPVGRMTVVSDPQGAVFSLMAPAGVPAAG